MMINIRVNIPMIELDDIDRRIVAALQAEGRLPMVDLAERVGLSPTPCQRRVKRLEEEGVIARYAALVSPPALGLGAAGAGPGDARRSFGEDRRGLRGGDPRPARGRGLLCRDRRHGFPAARLAPDLASFSDFAMKALLRMPGVRGTRSSFIMQAVKSDLAWAPRAPQPSASVRR